MYFLLLGIIVLGLWYLNRKFDIVENIIFYYEGWRDGDITFQMMYNYIVFQIRHLSSYYLEIGYMECQDNIFNLVYYSGSQKYRLIFPKQKKRYISYVLDEEGEDISHIFFEFLGPGNNFYSIPTTPEMLSLKTPITVGYLKGATIEEKIYLPNEIILTHL